MRVRSCCVHIPDPNELEDRRRLGNPEMFLSEMLSIFINKNLARILIPKPASLSSRSRIACLDFQQHIFFLPFCVTRFQKLVGRYNQINMSRRHFLSLFPKKPWEKNSGRLPPSKIGKPGATTNADMILAAVAYESGIEKGLCRPAARSHSFRPFNIHFDRESP